MVEKTVVITNPEGLHVWIKVGKTLAVAQGTEVVIGAEGEDEEKAVEELIDLVTTGFTED